jgi:hypothetical protein
MNKALFYFVMAVLILTNLVCLVLGLHDLAPAELIAVLIAGLVLSNLFLVIVKGWNIWGFLLTLFISGAGIWLLGLISVICYAFIFVTNIDTTLTMHPIVYGIRLASMFWPSTVLYLGYKFYQKSEREKPKEEK